MKLISEAEKELFIISPYYNVHGWHKMNKCIEEAKSKNINITFVVRKKEYNSISMVESILRSPVIEVEMLHAKIYLNEKTAIISSMNLSKSSDEKALDIAIATTLSSEYQEIYNYVQKYMVNSTQSKLVERSLHQSIENERLEDEVFKVVRSVSNNQISRSGNLIFIGPTGSETELEVRSRGMGSLYVKLFRRHKALLHFRDQEQIQNIMNGWDISEYDSALRFEACIDNIKNPLDLRDALSDVLQKLDSLNKILN